MLADLLDEALAVLRKESPPHDRLLRERLDGCTIAFTVDGERMATRGAEMTREPGASDAGANVDLRVETDAATVLALLDDRITLLEALRSGALKARGDRSAVARAEAAMRVFIHGLVRCPSAPKLLVKLNNLVEIKRGRNTPW